MTTQYGFFIDSARCTGCKTCELACKDYKNLTPEARQQLAAEQKNAGYRGNLYAYFMSRYMMNNPTP